MEESPHSDGVSDMAATLRSSLSSTELVLAKFNEVLRKRLMTQATTPPIEANKLALVSILNNSMLEMQSQYSKFKSSMEILMGLLGT